MYHEYNEYHTFLSNLWVIWVHDGFSRISYTNMDLYQYPALVGTIFVRAMDGISLQFQQV